jgi:hypothetical protein
VRLAVEQEMSELVGERTAHGPPEVRIALEDRHPGRITDDAAGRFEQRTRVRVRQVQMRLWPAIVELDPAERRDETRRRAALLSDRDGEGRSPGQVADAHERHACRFPNRISLVDDVIDECRRNIRRGRDGDDECGMCGQHAR